LPLFLGRSALASLESSVINQILSFIHEHLENLLDLFKLQVGVCLVVTGVLRNILNQVGFGVGVAGFDLGLLGLGFGSLVGLNLTGSVLRLSHLFEVGICWRLPWDVELLGMNYFISMNNLLDNGLSLLLIHFKDVLETGVVRLFKSFELNLQILE